MNRDGIIGPPSDPWAVAIHAQGEPHPIGAGVVIDPTRVLTCAHVVAKRTADKVPLWVTFPKAGVARNERRMIRGMRVSDESDVAVLHLADQVPSDVTPAVLRSPTAHALTGEHWWAFGFPDGTPYGADAYGTVGGPRAWGTVFLYTESRYGVKVGFSGSGLWSPRFEAVVGLVVQAQVGAHPGDGLALTLSQIERDLPEAKLGVLTTWSLPAAGDAAVSAWGWSLDNDEEKARHWGPRARGVMVDAERGFRFSGRSRALTEMTAWLDRSVPDRRVLVVTGSPGVGKSAVLGRIVTTADPIVRAALPSHDNNVKAELGSIACAVHAKGKSALTVAFELARAASVRLPGEVEDLVPALRAKLEQPDSPARFNIVVDALDEASSPAQARLIVESILLPLTQICSDVGAQVIVGTRRSDDKGDLVGTFGAAGCTINLDDEEYFSQLDLAAYAHATLQLIGAERPDNPYARDAVAGPVAQRIAELADRNFLIAGLVSRAHGLHDREPVRPDELVYTPTVDAALADYLGRLAPVGTSPAAFVLWGLAFAQAMGMSIDVWLAVLRSLGIHVTSEQLMTFAGSAAANFLVESSSDAGIRRYRLFHQALNDALLRQYDRLHGRVAGEVAILHGLVEFGRKTGWDRVDRYYLEALPLHADRASRVDALLTDDTYLLYADLMRLAPIADGASTPVGKARARMIHLTPRAIAASPSDRAALFDVTRAMEKLGRRSTHQQMPYRARWASVTQRTERATLEGHSGRVNGLCSLQADGRTLLASVSDDWTVRLWDPAISSQERVLRGHTRSATTICAVPFGGRSVLVSASIDQTVRLWDPLTGRELTNPLETEATSLCGFTAQDTTHIMIGGNDGALRLWSPLSGRLSVWSTGKHSKITALCPVEVASKAAVQHRIAPSKDVEVTRPPRIAVADRGWAVQLIEPMDGKVVANFAHHGVTALCTVTRNNQEHLVTAGDQEICLWHLDKPQTPVSTVHVSAAIRSICPIEGFGQTAIAITPVQGPISFLDFGYPRFDGEYRPEFIGTVAADQGQISASCTVAINRRTHMVTAGDDRIVRLWDPSTGQREAGLARHATDTMCAVEVGGVPLVASVRAKAVRLWNAVNGHAEPTLQGFGQISALCAVDVPRQPMLAGASSDSTVHLWDLTSRRQAVPLATHTTALDAVCSFRDRGQLILAGASADGSIWLWDPVKRKRLAAGFGGFRQRVDRLYGHSGRVRAICHIDIEGNARLASVGADNKLCLWDISTSAAAATIAMPKQHAVWSMATVAMSGVELLATGGVDGTVRLWNPVSGRPEHIFKGHTDTVRGLCTLRVEDQVLLSSVSEDRTVRLWALGERSGDVSIPVYHPALACVESAGALIVGLTAGMIAIEVRELFF